MQGNFILHRRPSIFRRQNFLLAALRYIGFLFFILTLSVSIGFAYFRVYDASATIFVFSMGITGYIVNSVINRQIQLNEITDSVIVTLRDRWDKMREDDSLLELLSRKTQTKLNEKEKLRVRLYLSTFIDAYVLIIRYVRYGYFDKKNERELAQVFENMIKALFEYPYIIEIWRSKDKYGKGCLRDEYSGTILRVVDNVIQVIEAEMIKSESKVKERR
jgi:hypothetical protein